MMTSYDAMSPAGEAAGDIAMAGSRPKILIGERIT